MNTQGESRAEPHPAEGAAGALAAERLGIQQEIDRRTNGQRLTPGQRRIAQCMIDNSGQLGFMSSMELAELADVSQPSVTRFAVALGFDGYLEMRKFLRAGIAAEDGALSQATSNRYQQAAAAEMSNLSELAQTLADTALIDEVGSTLAATRPLPVLGLRASMGLATDFAYFAAKVHPDVRLMTTGGSLVEDQIEQCQAAGASALLAFAMPLYPRETLRALETARQCGLRIVLVTDTGFQDDKRFADIVLKTRLATRLVFDSYASAALLRSVLLDAMCTAMKGKAQQRLDATDKSSRRRKVFER